MQYQTFSDGNVYRVNQMNGERTLMRRPPPGVVVHKEVCPLPDLESALRMVGNRPHTPCRHKFPDGKSAWRRRSFQFQGVPAEGTRCILCKLWIFMYFGEED